MTLDIGLEATEIRFFRKLMATVSGYIISLSNFIMWDQKVKLGECYSSVYDIVVNEFWLAVLTHFQWSRMPRTILKPKVILDIIKSYFSPILVVASTSNFAVIKKNKHNLLDIGNINKSNNCDYGGPFNCSGINLC